MTKVSELRKSLIEGGIPEHDVAKLNKKELTDLYEQTQTEDRMVALDLDKDFEEVKEEMDTPRMETVDDENRPDIHSKEWHNYVMSHFLPNELIDGNPITAGLRRVAELLLGSIIDSGPTSVFPPVESNGPGRATVVYKVVFDWNNSGLLRSFADTADVWYGNTDDLFCAHPVATASTRAEGRALRKALKLKVLAAEELAKKDIVNIVQQTTQQSTDGNWNPNDKISNQQINFIDSKCKQLDIDVYSFINMGKNTYGAIEEVTKDSAKNMIMALNKYQTQEVPPPKSIQGYRSDWRN